MTSFLKIKYISLNKQEHTKAIERGKIDIPSGSSNFLRNKQNFLILAHLKDFFIYSLNLSKNLSCYLVQQNGSYRDLFSKHIEVLSLCPQSIRLYLFIQPCTKWSLVGTYLFKNIIVATFTIAFLVDNNVVFAQEVIFRFRITRECASMVTIVFVR